MEALNNEKPIDKLFVKKGEIDGSVRVIVAKARQRGIVVSEAAKQKLDDFAEGGNHQGVVALCPAHEYCEVGDIIKIARDKGEEPFIIILDEIFDPHNLGAIIRTACAAGAHGVIIPKRRAAGLTSIVVKASAGATEYVPVARVNNIANVIDDLKGQNIWVACADLAGQDMYDAPLTGAVAVVIGSEGGGVRSLVRDRCDFAVKIPMFGKIPSLNASVATAVIMYEVVRRRGLK